MHFAHGPWSVGARLVTYAEAGMGRAERTMGQLSSRHQQLTVSREGTTDRKGAAYEFKYTRRHACFFFGGWTAVVGDSIAPQQQTATRLRARRKECTSRGAVAVEGAAKLSQEPVKVLPHLDDGAQRRSRLPPGRGRRNIVGLRGSSNSEHTGYNSA